jgi:hypothetical protein
MVLVAAAAITLGLGSLTAHAQRSSPDLTQSQFNAGFNNSVWSLAWGSDGVINAEENGVNQGFNSSPLFNGNSYTSDTWSMALTFSDGNVSISASSANLSGLDWNMNYPINSLPPVTELLLGANYQADNSESLTISSIQINNVPILGTATVNAGQSFSGLLLSDAIPITLLDYTVSIGTPTTWEQVNAGFQPSLLSMVGIPDAVPEPTTMALAGMGLLVSALALFRRK